MRKRWERSASKIATIPQTELVAKQVIEIRQRSGLDFPIGDQEARVSIKKKQPQKT
jgi:hypothetical protein